MQKTFVKEHWLEILLGLGILLQILALTVFNLTRLPYESNYDSSCAYAQVVEMWRQKRLILEDWSYQTTLGIDSPVLLGTLFYGLLKNPFTAFGLANLVTVFVYILIFYDILKQINVNLSARLLTILFLLTPYSTGQLGYMPMLFTSAGSYSYKLLVPLLLIDILIRSHRGKKFKNYWYLLAAESALVLLTAVSSGEYVLLCGILPIIGYEIFHVLLENDWKGFLNVRIVILLAESLLYVIGIKIGSRIGIESRGSSMTLTTAKDFPSVIGKCLVGIFQLFGGVTDYEDIVVTQLYGMMHLLRFFLAVCIIGAWIFLLCQLKKNKDYRELTGMVTCMFAVNLVVLIFADVTYATKTFEFRYHLISMLPMIMMIGPAAEVLLREKKLLTQTIVTAGVMVLVLVNIFNYKNYLSDCYNYQKDMKAITSMAEERGIRLIFSMGEESVQMGRSMRCVNPNVEISVWKGYQKGDGWGASTYYFENSNYHGPVMVMTTEKDYNEMPEYLADSMKYLQSFGDYQIYEVKENIFDADSTVPREGTNIDFFYSQGYNLMGELLNDQTIKITGKEKNFLKSGKKEASAGKIDLKISYEMGERTKAWILVTDNEGNVLKKSYFKPGKKEILLTDIEIDSGVEWVRYLFRGDKGGKIKINAIETIAKQGK